MQRAGWRRWSLKRLGRSVPFVPRGLPALLGVMGWLNCGNSSLFLLQNPLLRYGGMFAYALAYAGTASNFAIRNLLHFAISDVSDDVRRAAVISLGFVLSQVRQDVVISLSFYPVTLFRAIDIHPQPARVHLLELPVCAEP